MDLLLLTSLPQIVQTVLYFLLAILVLLVMITVHELGHYIVGKIFKFKIEEFAIGFGPAIYKKVKKNGEVFSIRLLPLGGFCAFAGEDELEEERKAKANKLDGGDTNDGFFDDDKDVSNLSVDLNIDTKNHFNNKPPWQRILVLISGAFMNFLLAILVSAIFLGIYGCPAYQVMSFTDNNGNHHTVSAPFIEEDIIVSIDGKNVYMLTDLMDAIGDKSNGETVSVVVLRDGKKVDLTITIGGYQIENVESVGETLSNIGVPALYKTSVRFGFFEMIGRVFEYTLKIGLSVLMILGQLITGKLGLSAMGGTVTTITTTAQGVQMYGVGFLLQITSLIGVNLAIFNLLPIPALDGSKVVFTLIEWIRGKPINRRVESFIHFIGIVLLFTFAIVVDLQHCF
jgi:regulator of sigma E protease